MGQVKILVRQIISACISYLTVDHRDFPMIPVIQEHIHDRDEGVKYAAGDSQPFHFLYKVCRDEADAAHIIVEYPDFHSLGHLADKHILNPFP